MNNDKCPKCGAKMDEGFLTDCRLPLQWISGKLEKSFLGIIKTVGREHRQIESYRCRS
jgi:hypothetical protein